jgi:hypothetical protein
MRLRYEGDEGDESEEYDEDEEEEEYYEEPEEVVAKPGTDFQQTLLIYPGVSRIS